MFYWFAMEQVRTDYERRDGQNIVEFQDMRYGMTPGSLEGLWSMRVTFDQTDQPRIEQIRHFHGRRSWPMIRQAWGDIWNP
jgi:hypothetical protein